MRGEKNAESNDLFQLLHESTSKLQYTNSEDEVFDLLAEFLQTIFPGTYFILGRKPDDDDFFVIHRLVGLEGFMGKIINILGIDPRNIKLPFNDMPRKNIELYENRKLIIFEDGLHDLSHHKLNRTVLNAVQSFLKIDKVGAMSLSVGKEYLGGVALLFKRDVFTEKKLCGEIIKVVETYIFQCSVLIKQFRDEKMLKKNHDELIEKNKELLQHTNFKNQIFSIIAHDLKAPFISLLGFTEILLNNYGDLSEEEREEYIQYMNSSSRSAFDLLNNLLHWSRVQFNNVSILKEDVPLHGLIHESIEPFRQNAYQKKIEVDVNVPKDIQVRVDKSTLGIVVYNLFMNAVKFSYEQSTIYIYGRKHNGKIEIGIRDTGIGMTEELKNKLLNTENIESNDGTNMEKGTGIGLMICKDFIKRNGGEFMVESKVNEGSTFQVILPQ